MPARPQAMQRRDGLPGPPQMEARQARDARLSWRPDPGPSGRGGRARPVPPERSAAGAAAALNRSHPLFSLHVPFATALRALSRLQHAEQQRFMNRNTSKNNVLNGKNRGGTVVAEYQACSECFAESVSEKKKKNGAQMLPSRLSACCQGEPVLNLFNLRRYTCLL